MKQLNFRHFNTNRKKFTVTVNFSQKEKKRLQKGQYYHVWYTNKISAIFGRFPIISEDFRRLPKIPEDYRRFSKTTEDVRGEIRKSSTIFRRYILFYSINRILFIIKFSASDNAFLVF